MAPPKTLEIRKKKINPPQPIAVFPPLTRNFFKDLAQKNSPLLPQIGGRGPPTGGGEKIPPMGCFTGGKFGFFSFFSKTKSLLGSTSARRVWGLFFFPFNSQFRGQGGRRGQKAPKNQIPAPLGGGKWDFFLFFYCWRVILFLRGANICFWDGVGGGGPIRKKRNFLLIL